MKTKINSVMIHNSGIMTQTFCVGETYNGLRLDHIKDFSKEFPDQIHVQYSGYTETDEFVFDVINVPVEVRYERAEDEVQDAEMPPGH